jgi:hypothetical protein
MNAIFISSDYTQQLQKSLFKIRITMGLWVPFYKENFLAFMDMGLINVILIDW